MPGRQRTKNRKLRNMKTNTRKLKVEALFAPETKAGRRRGNQPVRNMPRIRIAGKWLLTLGFVCGRRVTVTPIAEGQIVLTLEGAQ